MPVFADPRFLRPVRPTMCWWLPFGPSAHRLYKTQSAHHSTGHLPLCRGCPRIMPDVLMLIVPCRHCRNSTANNQPAYSRRLEPIGLSVSLLVPFHRQSPPLVLAVALRESMSGYSLQSSAFHSLFSSAFQSLLTIVWKRLPHPHARYCVENSPAVAVC
ncbi:MAG: hypothetical protein RLZZ232_2752 [Planctomycetota bacterium]|jgi:hypothetical protein